MFASAYIAGVIYQTASAITAVTDLVGDRIERQLLPQIERDNDDAFLIYAMPSPSLDDGPVGGPIGSQECRFEVALYQRGNDVSGLIDAAEALNAAFEDMDADVVDGQGDHHQVTCRRENELGDLPWEFGAPYVRVGGTYVFTFVI